MTGEDAKKEEVATPTEPGTIGWHAALNNAAHPMTPEEARAVMDETIRRLKEFTSTPDRPHLETAPDGSQHYWGVMLVEHFATPNPRPGRPHGLKLRSEVRPLFAGIEGVNPKDPLLMRYVQEAAKASVRLTYKFLSEEAKTEIAAEFYADRVAQKQVAELMGGATLVNPPQGE